MFTKITIHGNIVKVNGGYMKKKLFVLCVLFGGLFCLTGCGKQDANVEGSLEDLMAKVYENISEDNLPMGLTNMTVDEENIEGFLGTKDIEYTEALASESMIGSFAHSVVLVRAKDAKNIEDVKNTIKENVNPRKWVCVGVEKEDVIIKNKGDLIIVIIVENEEVRKELEKGFNEL